MPVIKTITTVGNANVNAFLVTHMVTDALVREHAISISSEEANRQGIGDAELHQSWFEMRNLGDGRVDDVWFVQWRVTDVMLQILAAHEVAEGMRQR